VDMGATSIIKFKCFEEGWEQEARTKKLSANEFRLLQKYKGVRFFDEEEEQIYEIWSNNLEWQKRINKDSTTPCYVVLAKPLGEDDDEGPDNDDLELVSYRINEALYDMIKDLRSDHPEGFQIEEEEEEEVRGEEQEDGDDDDDEE